MEKGIRVTTLGSFYACAYKHKNQEFNIKVEDTYKGDILNAAATSESSIDPLLDYYIKNINQSLKLRMVLKDCCTQVAEYVKDMKKNTEEFSQERKFVLKYNREYYIEGTPDIYYKDADGWIVEDLKMSTHSRFEHEDSWIYNMQTYLYPLFVMEYYNVDECRFAYMVYDKGNGKGKKIGPRVRTRRECRDKLDEVMTMYIEAEFTGEYKANKQRMCRFCPLKKLGCPAYAGEQAESSSI